MNKFFRKTALAALMLAALPAAQAATYSFSGMMASGSLIGDSFLGSMSFDASSLIGNGLEIFSLTSLSIGFAGHTYTLADADAAPDVSYLDGTFLGLSYSASGKDPQIGFVAGTQDASDAYFSYDTSLGPSGSSDITYAPVPEPETYAMLLAGLGLLGLVARLKAFRG
jgi:hypothetical protein